MSEVAHGWGLMVVTEYQLTQISYVQMATLGMSMADSSVIFYRHDRCHLYTALQSPCRFFLLNIHLNDQ